MFFYHLSQYLYISRFFSWYLQFFLRTIAQLPCRRHHFENAPVNRTEDISTCRYFSCSVYHRSTQSNLLLLLHNSMILNKDEDSPVVLHCLRFPSLSTWKFHKMPLLLPPQHSIYHVIYTKVVNWKTILLYFIPSFPQPYQNSNEQVDKSFL
jgi:hypothetical protein